MMAHAPPSIDQAKALRGLSPLSRHADSGTRWLGLSLTAHVNLPDLVARSLGTTTLTLRRQGPARDSRCRVSWESLLN